MSSSSRSYLGRTPAAPVPTNGSTSPVPVSRRFLLEQIGEARRQLRASRAEETQRCNGVPCGALPILLALLDATMTREPLLCVLPHFSAIDELLVLERGVPWAEYFVSTVNADDAHDPVQTHAESQTLWHT
ncbi:hypothetical protein FOMPIDRAFT_91341 [Fomitopsis schrenkii]|uniref:Uncharacterized protein n=1 Tax=Fomitopsis schrenkii TaxID=2126942 RepID=S8E0U6_FOMSC|nr:hypothetical protein FOMPIDRAFT_91341 [Fomitopsis schrenkii]